MRGAGPLLKVLRRFLADPSVEIYGLELRRATGLASGTLYPILERLERDGLVMSDWEQADPSDVGRPRRRFYRLTASGVHEARQIMLEHGVEEGLRWI